MFLSLPSRDTSPSSLVQAVPQKHTVKALGGVALKGVAALGEREAAGGVSALKRVSTGVLLSERSAISKVAASAGSPCACSAADGSTNWMYFLLEANSTTILGPQSSTVNCSVGLMASAIAARGTDPSCWLDTYFPLEAIRATILSSPWRYIWKFSLLPMASLLACSTLPSLLDVIYFPLFALNAILIEFPAVEDVVILVPFAKIVVHWLKCWCRHRN